MCVAYVRLGDNCDSWVQICGGSRALCGYDEHCNPVGALDKAQGGRAAAGRRPDTKLEMAGGGEGATSGHVKMARIPRVASPHPSPDVRNRARASIVVHAALGRPRRLTPDA